MYAIQVMDYNITPGTPTITLEVSIDGIEYAEYDAPRTSNINISNTANRFNYDNISPFIYMRVVYTSNSSTGTFSIKVTK